MRTRSQNVMGVLLNWPHCCPSLGAHALVHALLPWCGLKPAAGSEESHVAKGMGVTSKMML